MGNCCRKVKKLNGHYTSKDHQNWKNLKRMLNMCDFIGTKERYDALKFIESVCATLDYIVCDDRD